MRYLVIGSEGPGFASPQETIEVLEKVILPTFETLTKLEADKRIVAGGLPVGERAFVFVAEARRMKIWTGCCAASRPGACSSGR